MQEAQFGLVCRRMHLCDFPFADKEHVGSK